MNLPIQSEVPLFGVVSRLYRQKRSGFTVGKPSLSATKPKLNSSFWEVDRKPKKPLFLNIAKEFPDRLAAFIGFDDALARRIFAGTDFFLMPSRFEPCGLAQQYAMRYGSVPIGRKTGGLADTVQPVGKSQNSANGFLFERSEPEALLEVINKAIHLFHNRKLYSEVQKNALNLPCSWEFAAEEYQKVYSWALADS